MKRRDFLAATSTFLIPAMVEGFGVKAFGINSPLVQSLLKTNALAKDRVLVIIYLGGGNDGLNTVIPIDQMVEYTSLRTSIAIPESSVLRLGNGSTGLHPSMTGLKQMHDDGKMSIVHSVLYPTPNFSHHGATEIWMTANDDSVNPDFTTGWAGRYLDKRFTDYPITPTTDRDDLTASMEDPLAIQIGYSTSTILLGEEQTMSISINNPTTFEELVGGGSGLFSADLPCDNTCEAANLITFIRNQQVLAIGYGREITRADKAGKMTPEPFYPQSTIADQLKIVAKLIGGGLKTKIYFVSMGGFDTHSAQVEANDKTKGSHATLLGRLSAGIKAFQDDLQSRGVEDKVAGFTFSEFGRRATSNGSFGTDHGAAAPMFVFGSSLKRQSVGRNPNIGGYSNLPSDLTDSINGNKNLKMQVDFRRIYWDILTDWFGTSKTEAASILYDKSFDTVSLFTEEVCTIKSGDWHDEATWSCARVPFFTENIRICEGHTVTVAENTLVKKIQNFGKLIVAPGKKLSLG